ncbi:NADPH-dependent ferric siderophore reductase [Prauserella marina]|uniref:NADPH-dependent ferric siderophore reductase, contains FAD-binding and SIP domains n=1 Tax=Prauserella marina TaxID=530584 RepID=A0A222VKC0_9PSEU|nr:siderophore-interacting protein [Prauserella marina]ASR34355.1 NADPH-dependent ferric siderophore reductase [Prauserella marina]PWV71855.1 NADPH-dependent ferric siderophore reductase [Prauserella marina]SDD89391.1 NADPH-dependent ferric siderophore reductase, contains FAD-binding and SIP domains [Prauserella marina]
MTTQAAPPQLTYRSLRVTAARRLSPHLTRITFTGDDLAGFASAAPDQYVKVFFPLPGEHRPQLPPPIVDDVGSWYRTYLAMPDDIRPPMRTYTIRAHRPEVPEIDIDFVLHADSGPASAWAERAEPGAEVALLGPHGLYSVPEGTGWQLLVGDESAIPAIGAILEALPENAKARVFVEIADPADRQHFATAADVETQWVPRGDGGYGDAILAAVREAELPNGQPYAWVSGEANMVKLTRRHLVRERGVDKRVITFTGYWRVGKSEEQTGRESIRKADAGEIPQDED